MAFITLKQEKKPFLPLTAGWLASALLTRRRQTQVHSMAALAVKRGTGH
jgi:hypothetical protein